MTSMWKACTTFFLHLFVFNLKVFVLVFRPKQEWLPQTPKPEPPVQRTVQDTPRHCGCASRAADRSCLAARQRDRHTNVSECPRHHLKGTAPWRAQKPHACPDRWQIPSHCLDSCLHWWVCWGGDEKWWQWSQHQILRWWHHFPLSSWCLQCSNYRAEILAISTAAEHLLGSWKKMGKFSIFTDSLSTLQALNSADPDQMIQGLHFSLAKLTAQFTVSLQWVPAHVGLTGNEKADRLAKNQQSGSADTESCHLQRGQDTSPLLVQWRLEETQRWISGTPWPNLETGAGPADHYLPPAHRALWSECPSEEDWHFRHFPVWVRTSWPNPRPRPSVLPKVCRETSAKMATGCWSDDQAVGLGRRPLPDGWFCGIKQTEDLTCTAVDRWRRRRRRVYLNSNHHKLKKNSYSGLISRVPNQNGVSQAWFIVEIHHSGPEPSI